MEENTKMVYGDLRPTIPIYQTMPNNVSQLKMKINPTDTTLRTHLSLPNGSLSAAPSTHTTMPAIEWLRLRKLKLERKQSIGKFEKWITSPTQTTISWKLSKAGEAYARCSTSLSPFTQTMKHTG